MPISDILSLHVLLCIPVRTLLHHISCTSSFPSIRNYRKSVSGEALRQAVVQRDSQRTIAVVQPGAPPAQRDSMARALIDR